MRELSEQEFQDYVEEISGVVRLLCLYDEVQIKSIVDTAYMLKGEKIVDNVQVIYSKYCKNYELNTKMGEN